MCGSTEKDWINPETGRIFDEPLYTPVGIKCHGCAEIDQYKSSTFDNNSTPPGVTVVLYPNDLVDQDGRILKEPIPKNERKH